MTKKEQIASILLGAADLLKEDQILTEGASHRDYMNYCKKAGVAQIYKEANAGNKEKMKEYISVFRKFINEHSDDRDILVTLGGELEIFPNDKTINGEFATMITNQLVKPLKKKLNVSGTFNEEHERLAKEKQINKKKEKYDKKIDKYNKKIEKVNAKKNALSEAIDLYYEKAILCEDASEAADYIAKANELEALIDD